MSAFLGLLFLFAVLAGLNPPVKEPPLIPPAPVVEPEAEGLDTLLKRAPVEFREGVKLDKARSGHWAALRKEHLKKEPCCQWCGGTYKLQVHHIRPFHLHPELELDPDNLITLCQVPETDHHLDIGHNGNFVTGYNLNVRRDCDKHEKELRAKGLWGK